MIDEHDLVSVDRFDGDTYESSQAAEQTLNAAILRATWKAVRSGSFFGKWMFCFWMGEMVHMLSADILTYWRILPLYFWVLAQAVIERKTSAIAAG